MSIRRRAAFIGAAATIALFALAGCAPAGGSAAGATSTPRASAPPTTTPTTTPASSSPTPVPAPDPAVPPTLVLGGESAALTAADGTLGDYPYGGPADVLLASLTAVLGAPETVVHQGEKCVTDSVENVWGGLRVAYDGMDPVATPLVRFSVQGDVGGGLVVESPHGARVGGSWPEFAASIPDAPMTTGEYEGATWVDVIDGGYSAWGATAGTLVNTDDSVTITSITAPNDLGHDC